MRSPLPPGLIFFLPGFGLGLSLVLVALGAWRAIGAAAVTAALLVLASLLAFGTAPWVMLLAEAGGHHLGHGGGVAPGSMGTYQSLRKLGLEGEAALTAFLVLSATVIVLVWRGVRARPADAVIYALLGGILVCPVVWPYQWALPTLGAAALAAREGFARTPRTALAALVALGGLPAMLMGGMMTLPVTIGAFCLLGLLACPEVTPRRERPSEALTAA